MPLLAFRNPIFVRVTFTVSVDLHLKSLRTEQHPVTAQLPKKPRSEKRGVDQNLATLIRVAFNYDCALAAIKFYEQKPVFSGSFALGVTSQATQAVTSSWDFIRNYEISIKETRIDYRLI